ncbi:MAG: glycoside hydrolase family 38 C-terminal domain-containing protein, partial [Candidatus Hydrogenedentota bacterium]
ARVGFNPDSFGHAGTLPQIYKKMGIDYYVYMRPDAVREMDYPEGTTFWWKAKDGSRILACNLQETYTADAETLERIGRIVKNPHLNPGQSHVIVFYGVGNHGGGPTKQAIEQIQEAHRRTDLPDTQFSTLLGYFEGFLATTKDSRIPVIATDLQHHARGCYSAHAGVKRMNRRAEHELMVGERLATVAWLLFRRPCPKDRLARAWRYVLYNQFHDILAGTSLESSYEDVRDQQGAARTTAVETANEALQVISSEIDTTPEGNTIVAFNPLPWPVKETLVAPQNTSRFLEGPLHLNDDRGKTVPMQVVQGQRIDHVNYAFTAELPSFGYRCYHLRSGAKKTKISGMLEAGRDFLENDWWRLEFDPYNGHICRLFDKENDLEVLRKGNALAAMVDASDTWSHGYDEFGVEAGRFGNARLTLLEAGDVRATMMIVSSYGRSQAETYVTLYRAINTIDCRFRINWQERHTMLKLVYETNIEGGDVACDTAYGIQKRPASGEEEPCQKWIDLTGSLGTQSYGLALLNDGQYGFDVRDGVLRQTLLRSPAYAHHENGRVDASYPWPIMDQGWHRMHFRLVPHVGSYQAARVPRRAWSMNEPVLVHVESAHAGTLPPCVAFMETSAENVILSVIKPSEAGEDLIVRGYETDGVAADVRIRFSQLERNVTAHFDPYEIKTIRIPTDSWEARDTDFLEE